MFVSGEIINPGQIMDSVKSSAFPDQYYALLLPSDYSNNQKYPLLFFFEPAARATLPLKEYIAVVDSYKIILACSYNSRNGSFDVSVNAANAVIEDVSNKYNIDTDNIILSGFSGGARAAYYYSVTTGKNYGVIGCGAGLPALLKNPIPPKFPYSILMGDSDFNFNESLVVKEAFQEKHSDIYYINFKGYHSWPPVQDFKRALSFHLIWNNNLDSLALESFIYDEIDIGIRHKESLNLLNYLWCLENLQLIDNVANTSLNIADSLLSLKKNKEYRKQVRQLNNIKKLEDSLSYSISVAVLGIEKTAYNNNADYKPMYWWRNKIDYFRKLASHSNRFKQSLGERLLGQISIRLWERNRKMVNLGLFDQALEMAEILIYLNPNIGSYYALKAEAMVGKNDKQSAMDVYSKALKKGFDFESNSFLRNSSILRILHSESIKI